jgi:hypothetical protein
LYFLSGLLGTAMIATGMILWTVKRRPAQLKKANGPDFGHRLVESLNLGTIVGLPIAIAAYFWANRLLPVDFAARSEWEVHVMFLVWLATLLYPLSRNIMRGWVDLLWMAAAAYGLLPIINAVTTDRHLANSLTQGDWLFAGVDLTFLATGMLFAVAAVKLQQRLQRTSQVTRINSSNKQSIDNKQIVAQDIPLQSPEAS